MKDKIRANSIAGSADNVISITSLYLTNEVILKNHVLEANQKNNFYLQFGKRLIDIFLSAFLLLLLTPLFLIISALILIKSYGPVFYKSIRVGKNGNPFMLYKFRTMSLNAEKQKKQLLKDNERKGPVFKMKNDPRVSLVGFFLRKFSLDELPQLWNILNGDMSLIGPRPAIPDEVKEYSSIAMKRLAVMPGLTGYWQVNGRAALPFTEGIELDIYYIKNLSFSFDLKILLQTIPAALFGKGAY